MAIIFSDRESIVTQCLSLKECSSPSKVGKWRAISAHPPRQIKLRIKLRIKIRARRFWRAFGLRARSTSGGGRPGTRTAPPPAHVSPPTRPEPPVQLVRSRFAGFF